MDFIEPDFILLNHTADLGINVRGADMKDLFVKAALAMTQIMVNVKPAGIAKRIPVSLDGHDPAELMVRWLGEILYIFDGEKQIVTRIEINAISPCHLDATLEATPFDPDLHEIIREIKAVTYHQIEVSEKDGFCDARIYFDL